MYDEHYDDSELPSRQIELLRKLRGRTIVQMERFAPFPPTSREHTELSKTPPEHYFSYCGGAMLITLDTGLEVRVGSDPTLISVGISVEKTEDGIKMMKYPLRDYTDSYCVNVLNPIYSNDTLRSFVGKRIKTFRLLRIAPVNSRCENYPREAGLIMVFEDNSELLLSHGLHWESDDFSVITPEMIDPKFVPMLTEIPLNM